MRRAVTSSGSGGLCQEVGEHRDGLFGLLIALKILGQELNFLFLSVF